MGDAVKGAESPPRKSREQGVGRRDFQGAFTSPADKPKNRERTFTPKPSDAICTVCNQRVHTISWSTAQLSMATTRGEPHVPRIGSHRGPHVGAVNCLGSWGIPTAWPDA